MLDDPEGCILCNLVAATRCVLEGVEVAGIPIIEGALLLQVLDDAQREELPLDVRDRGADVRGRGEPRHDLAQQRCALARVERRVGGSGALTISGAGRFAGAGLFVAAGRFVGVLAAGVLAARLTGFFSVTIMIL